MKILSGELIDAIGDERRRVHGEGVIKLLNRVCEVLAHTLSDRALVKCTVTTYIGP